MELNLTETLKNARTIAIIGCSPNEYRTSHHIASYLQEQGYTIIPIHPDHDEVLGEKAYDSILDIPDDVEVDVVDIFRDSQYTAEMVDEILKWSEKTGQEPVIWTQLGVSSPEAKEKSEKVGLPYVEEKCMMVEHKRLLG
jgi:predicted CoA-binding protein